MESINSCFRPGIILWPISSITIFNHKTTGIVLFKFVINTHYFVIIPYKIYVFGFSIFFLCFRGSTKLKYPEAYLLHQMWMYRWINILKISCSELIPMQRSECKQRCFQLILSNDWTYLSEAPAFVLHRRLHVFET